MKLLSSSGFELWMLAGETSLGDITEELQETLLPHRPTVVQDSQELGRKFYTGPLTHSLAPLTHSLAAHYSLRSRARLRSFIRSFILVVLGKRIKCLKMTWFCPTVQPLMLPPRSLKPHPAATASSSPLSYELSAGRRNCLAEFGAVFMI